MRMILGDEEEDKLKTICIGMYPETSLCIYAYYISYVQLYAYVRCLGQNTSVYIVYYASLLSVSFIQRQDYDEIKIYIFW